MPLDKFEKYCRREGFCCSLALLTARKEWRTWAIAEDAEVTERDIRYHRQQVREGSKGCPHRNNCMLRQVTAAATIHKHP